MEEKIIALRNTIEDARIRRTAVLASLKNSFDFEVDVNPSLKNALFDRIKKAQNTAKKD